LNEYADATKEFFRHVADGYKGAQSNGNLHTHNELCYEESEITVLLKDLNLNYLFTCLENRTITFSRRYRERTH